MTTAPISNPTLLIKPSTKLAKFLRTLKSCPDTPADIKQFSQKSHKRVTEFNITTKEPTFLLTQQDKEFLKSLKLEDIKPLKPLETSPEVASQDKLVSLQSLHWVYDQIKNNSEKVYLHELLEGSDVILPSNPQVPRNEELEKRCQRLKAEQENRQYQDMTKNVDNSRRLLPEDTIAYQLKQMNRHLIAIFQFILSVAAGFAFGFLGVELLIGSLDFGFRLLLGIICSLTIALAELYFLAKRLNEDMMFETAVEQKRRMGKVD